ncbi:MAG: LysM peptidoglycan-binding domain-containing protein [Pseudomonadota bacterium]
MRTRDVITIILVAGVVAIAAVFGAYLGERDEVAEAPPAATRAAETPVAAEVSRAETAAAAGEADVNDPASFPDEPGRSFVDLGTDRPETLERPDTPEAALDAPEGDPLEDARDAVDAAALRQGAADEELRAAATDPDGFTRPADGPSGEAGRSTDAQDAPIDDLRPVFDLVRVERDGSAQIAGRAEPGALVSLLIDGEVAQEVRANPRGEFVVLVEAPTQGLRTRRFELRARTADGVELASLDPVIIAAPERPEDPPIAVRPTRERVEVLAGGPSPSGDDISIDSVSYTDEGQVEVSGRGTPGEVTRVYLDNALEAEARVNPDGDWRVRLQRDVKPAIYTLRVDQMTTTGIVTSRAETPFERAAPDMVVSDDAVIVQPGNNLWRIADYVYGDGRRFTTIFNSNRDQIRNPNLIYPGQIFSLPERSDDGAVR